VLLARHLARSRPLRVLDAMAGCGIRALRYALEADVSLVWANDADPDRVALIRANLAPLAERARVSAGTAQQLLAGCMQGRERFQLVDLDGFGCPSALVPLALEAVAFGGVLYLTSSDGRSPTGHDRRAAIRSLGAAARAHPAAWELALRLQVGVLARQAWAQGRGLTPLLSFSEGRTFRTAVQLRRRPATGEERQLGLLAHCHGCGDQQMQSLLQLRGWEPCRCGEATAAPATGSGVPSLAISGPLWIGPLQDPATLEALLADAPQAPGGVDAASLRLLRRLADDPGDTPRCWPLALIARQLDGGPPPLQPLIQSLRQRGHRACSSGVMDGQLRSDAPWPEILALAGELQARPSRSSGLLNR